MTGDVRTSGNFPIKVDCVNKLDPDLPGNLGMTLAPGVKDDSSSGFRWERDVHEDVRVLREEHGTELLVSLMECYEYEKYGMHGFFQEAKEIGIRVIHAPILDVGVPKAWEENMYVGLILDLKAALEAGKTVVVHCRGGLGRTGMVAASVLVAFGYDAIKAIETVREARDSRMVETREQEEYVREFARSQKWNR